MKSLIALAALLLAPLLASADAAPAVASSPILGSPDVVVVIGPFPLEVFEGANPDTPSHALSGTGGYLNLGFFELDTTTGEAWPYGFGAIFDRMQQRAAIEAPVGDAG